MQKQFDAFIDKVISIRSYKPMEDRVEMLLEQETPDFLIGMKLEGWPFLSDIAHPKTEIHSVESCSIEDRIGYLENALNSETGSFKTDFLEKCPEAIKRLKAAQSRTRARNATHCKPYVILHAGREFMKKSNY